MKRLVIGLILVLTGVAAAADKSADELYFEARQLALDGEREQAKAICRQVLADSPGYHDVRVLLARLHAWDKDYDESLSELDAVLRKKPGHSEALQTKMDVLYWNKDYSGSLGVAERGLEEERQNVRFLYGKARALAKLERWGEAAEAAELASAQEPDRADIRNLLRRALDEALVNKVSVDYEYEDFDDDTDPWQQVILAWRRTHVFGSMIYRVNLADRFDSSGAQFEVDSYPRIARKTYLFLNAGVSGSSLFPDWRLGAEVFHNFPLGWEGSFGFRYLGFDDGVWIWTGSIAKYQGSWWIALRPNYVDKVDGSSSSGQIQIRRYLGGRYEYVGLTVGGGESTLEELVTRSELDSFSVKLEARKKIFDRWLLKGAVGRRERELTPTRDRESWFFRVGFDVFFGTGKGS